MCLDSGDGYQFSVRPSIRVVYVLKLSVLLHSVLRMVVFIH
jgi:hypothetical protein